MAQPPVGKAEPNLSSDYAILLSQEPLPPYELDPCFDDPVVRKRIGEIISRSTVFGHLKPRVVALQVRSPRGQ